MTPVDTPSPVRKRAATIVDVAEAAGVAIGTVSRHLNGLPVRAGNRNQIERAIADLGFRRNANAVAMKTDTTHIVGFFAPSLSEFHAAMLDQLTRKMRHKGRAVLSLVHDLQASSIREGLEFFARHRVDAIVVDGEDAVRRDLQSHVDNGMAIVLYDNDIPGLLADRIFVSNRKSSARLVGHLIELGHRRIATIHGDPGDSAGFERLGGFLDAMQSNGVQPDPTLIRNGRWQEIDAYELTLELLQLDEPPTAIFSANYNMTLGIIARLQERGVVIPRDMSLVGFDDVAALRLHNPGITTVGQPIEKLAEAITALVDERLANPQAMGRRAITLDCDILLRESVRRLP